MRRRAVLMRQWDLIQNLQGLRTGLRSVDLAKRLGVSLATVNRDLSLLRDAGVPLERNEVNGEVRHRFSRGPLPALQPTPIQAVALRLARGALQPLEGSHLLRELDLLLAGLPAIPVAEHLSHAAPAAASPSIVRTLESALRLRRQLELRYRAGSRAGRETHYRVDPLRLRLVHQNLYLCAYVPARDGARTFKVVRIAEAHLLDEAAKPHPEWTDDRLFGRAVKMWSGDPVEVAVRLAPDVAHLAVEYPLAEDQTVERRLDGSALVRARVAGIVEVRSWVLSWGAAAEVLEPAELRRAVREELETALGAYQRKRPVRARERDGGEKIDAKSQNQGGRRRGKRR
jgi:predicted DNA-binding transcriptional regulator YafY